MSFTQALRRWIDPVWQASFEHPFITGVAKGTLPMDRFRFYVQQDSYYLTEFGRVLAAAASRAGDLPEASELSVHVRSTYEVERALHESFAHRLGLSEEELGKTEPAPTAYAYTSHLRSVAFSGTLGEIVAAVLPCDWLYQETGQRLQGAHPSQELYREWIAAYADPAFEELVVQQLARLDRLAAEATASERERMARHFLVSSRYELRFWEMAYTLEGWDTPEPEGRM